MLLFKKNEYLKKGRMIMANENERIDTEIDLESLEESQQLHWLTYPPLLTPPP